MPRDSLSDRQVTDYAESGYVSPLTAFTAGEAAGYRARLETMEREVGGITHDRARKMHLYLRWVDEIVHHPRILDAVQDLIGPDILLYHLTLWLKEPKSDARISWHQDSTYFGLAPPLHVTAWVALTVSAVSTRLPDSAAWHARLALSRSGSSPIMTTSESWRRTARRKSG